MRKDDYKPIIFEEPSVVKTFINKNPHVYNNDAFEKQIKELFFIDNHQFIGQEKTKVYKSSEFVKYKNKKRKDFLYNRYYI